MTNIMPRPLNRFRKTDNHRMFHERWGDMAISAPTDTWSHANLNLPKRSVSRKRVPRHDPIMDSQFSRGSSRSAASVFDDDDTICLVDSSNNSNDGTTTPSRQNSFSLNPRRLSMRLAPRPRLSSEDPKEQKDKEKDKKVEFAYKPIHQDYPTEVAAKAARHNPPASPSRFRYIPAAPQYSGDLEMASWKRYSTISRGSMQGEGVVGLPPRPCNRRNSSRSDETYDRDDDDYDDGKSTQSVACRSNAGYGQRAVATSPKNASSSTDKKRARSSRYLTMTMVPDPEDIYG